MTWGSIALFGGFLEKENPLETLIVIFENVSPKGFSWLKMKYFEISVFKANSQYWETFRIRQTANRKSQTAVTRLQFRVAEISNFSKAFSSVQFIFI